MAHAGKTLEVVIRGKAGTGKTRTAHLIKRALEGEGFEVELRDFHAPPAPPEPLPMFGCGKSAVIRTIKQHRDEP